MNHMNFKISAKVLCQVFLYTKDKLACKLAPKYEGPYKVVSILMQGAYNLGNTERIQLKKSWNLMYLSKYYH